MGELLKNWVIHIKKTLRADEQVREDIRKQREKWQKWSKTAPYERLVFLDESAAKTDLAPLRGWGRKRCFGNKPGSWKTVRMLSFLRYDGKMMAYNARKPVTLVSYRLSFINIGKLISCFGSPNRS